MSVSLTVSRAALCFIACHGGPADHFATFIQSIEKEEYDIQVCATGPALKKFQEKGITVRMPFSLDNLSTKEEEGLADQIARSCAAASIVFTDVGHPFDVRLQRSLAKFSDQAYRIAYYDNPEVFVPGGYSATAMEVMGLADKVLFANANLPASFLETLDQGKGIGLGYYPVQQAEKMEKRRASEGVAIRKQFLQKNGLQDQEQRIFVYFGGNNEEYFNKAFPAFLDILAKSKLDNSIVVLQQHPGAKAKNSDGNQVSVWMKENYAKGKSIIISDFSSDDAQILADVALYYQTSMSPQFVLAGIPTLQIGHEPYMDLLVRSQLSPSVTTPKEFESALVQLKQASVQREVIFQKLGIKSDWNQIFKRTIKELLQQPKKVKLKKQPIKLWPYFAGGAILLICYFAARHLKR